LRCQKVNINNVYTNIVHHFFEKSTYNLINYNNNNMNINNNNNFNIVLTNHYNRCMMKTDRRREHEEILMKILTKAIVSNSDMIKNYKACREKAENFGKIFILKNNQPDGVLFSISEYERLSAFIEYTESLEDKDIEKFVESLPQIGKRLNYSIGNLRDDIISTECTPVD